MTRAAGALGHPWDELVLVDVDLPADLSERRRGAVAEAAAGAEPVTPDGRGEVGARRYGAGCLALAVRGCFEQCPRELLRALADELPRAASRELVVDCSGLEVCDPALARALARVRIRCLTRGARVELHEPPPALAAEIGRPLP
jgi:STAS domain